MNMKLMSVVLAVLMTVGVASAEVIYGSGDVPVSATPNYFGVLNGSSVTLGDQIAFNTADGNEVKYFPNLDMIFVSEDSAVYTVDNGSTLVSLGSLRSLTYRHSDGLFVGIDGNMDLVWSTDIDSSWNVSQAGSYNAVEYSEDMDLFVAVGIAGAVASSSDGINWDVQTVGQGDKFNDVAYGSSIGTWLAVGDTGLFASSTDGGNWTYSLNMFGPYLDVLWVPSKSKFVAVGSSGSIASGTSESTMSENLASGDQGFLGVAYSPENDLYYLGTGTDSGETYTKSTWGGTLSAHPDSSWLRMPVAKSNHEAQAEPVVEEPAAEETASSSSGGTRYVVDASGNVVGVSRRGNVQLVDAPDSPAASAPRFNLDLKSWLLDLWARIEGVLFE